MKWFSLRNKPVQPIIEGTLEEWMNSEQVAELSKLLRTPTMSLAMKLLMDTIPIPAPTAGAKDTDIIFSAGATAGYALCLQNLRKLAEGRPPEEIEATYKG